MSRSVCDGAQRQIFRHHESHGPNPTVRHSIVDIEAIRRTNIITPIDRRRKDDIVDPPPVSVGRCWRKHRISRAVAKEMGLFLGKHHDAG